MEYRSLRYQIEGAVARIVLARPQAYNALDATLGRELLEAAVAADEDDAVRAIVVTGAGAAFCAGGDLKFFAENLDGIGAALKRLIVDFHGAVSRLVRTPKPVLTAVNGVAAGAGMSLALAGDFVLAAESARFTLAYGAIGASPDGGSTWFLPRLLGQRRAMELYLTNRTLAAREALDWGLVTRVVEDAQFEAQVQALAGELAAGPTFACGRAKALFQRSLNETLETQMEYEAQAIAACARSEDFRNAVRAFAEKRPRSPFRGR